MPDHGGDRATALVTGGAGFLGTRVVAELLGRGFEVSVLDLRAPAEGRLLRSGGLRHLTADIRDREATREAVRSSSPGLVVHLAALHFIPACIKDPATTLETNVVGTQHVLDGCAELASPPRFVLASTADVYEPSPVPHGEDAPVSPDNVYGLSKLAAEQLVAIAARQGSCRPLVCRFFNLYGANETNPHVIPAIVEQLRASDVLRLGNTTPKRDFVYVADAARALLDLSDVATPGATVNVGTGTARSVDEVVEMIRHLTGRDVRIEVDKERWRASDRPVLQADNRVLRSLLPDALPTDFLDGLRSLLTEEGIEVVR